MLVLKRKDGESVSVKNVTTGESLRLTVWIDRRSEVSLAFDDPDYNYIIVRDNANGPHATPPR